MILLHKLSPGREAFHLNPDLIATVEARPDTVVSLTTEAKVVVAETPDEVAAAVRGYRVQVLDGALRRGGPLASVGAR